MSAIPANATAVTGSGAISATTVTFRGLSLKDTSGSGNTIKVYNNGAASGTIVFERVLAANGDVTLLDTTGIRCNLGLYLSCTGAVEGSVFTS